MSSKSSWREGKGYQPLLPVVDPCEGAQLGAAEAPEVLLLLIIPLDGDVQGWLAGGGRQGRVWGEGQR